MPAEAHDRRPLLSPAEPLTPKELQAVQYGSIKDSSLSADPSDPSGLHSTYGSFVGYCFCVNYILGVGVLGIPYAFFQGGIILSIIVLAFVTVLAMLVIFWLPEVMARAEGATVSWETGVGQVRNRVTSSRKFEINELVGLFVGLRARVLYEVCIVVYFVGALWSYASVFGSSLAAQVPLPFFNGGNTCSHVESSTECHNLYLFYLAIFSVIVIPLTCLELPETKGLQIFLALFRFVAMTIMILTSLVALFEYPNPIHPESHESPPYYSDVSMFRLAGFSTLFPIAVYSQIFVHSVPGLAKPIEDKGALQKVFVAVLSTTFTFYALVGVSVSLFYGSKTNSTCSLNWSHYKGSSTSSTPLWASMISYTVVLFPALDVISAFPLNATTLANNVSARFLSKPKAEQTRRDLLPFRLFAAIVPIVGACIVSNLATILDYTGCLGIVIAFITPALLQIYSVRFMDEHFGSGSHKTPYTSSPWSQPWVAKSVLGIGAVSFILVIVFSVV